MLDLHNSNAFTRREFLWSGLTLASAAMFVPSFIQRSALGLPMPAPGLSSIPGVNDGLNTLVPYGDGAYYKARPGIAIPENKVVKLDKTAGRGLHPALAPLADLYNEGQAALRRGDWEAYGEAQRKLGEAIRRLAGSAPAGGSVTVTPPPTSTPPASPTPSPTPTPSG